MYHDGKNKKEDDRNVLHKISFRGYCHRLHRQLFPGSLVSSTI